MADDPTPKPDDKPEPDPDAGAKKALDAERKARRDAESKLTDLQKRLDEIESKDKTEVQRLTDQLAAVTKDRDEHASKSIRSDIAIAKGLTPAQAKRLVGATKEELEADADEILEAFPVGNAAPKPPPSDRPKPTLRGGNDPSDEPEETDPRKLAAMVPRD